MDGRGVEAGGVARSRGLERALGPGNALTLCAARQVELAAPVAAVMPERDVGRCNGGNGVGFQREARFLATDA
jgi:hypothetical protein